MKVLTLTLTLTLTFTLTLTATIANELPSNLAKYTGCTVRVEE